MRAYCGADSQPNRYNLLRYYRGRVRRSFGKWVTCMYHDRLLTSGPLGGERLFRQTERLKITGLEMIAHSGVCL